MSIKALTSRRAAIAAAVGVLGLGAYSVQTYFSRSSIAEADNPPKTFGGRLGFASLPLHSAEIVNHNTKRVVFKLPEKNAQSGLSLTYDPGFLTLLVKEYSHGKSSTGIHSLQPGQTLTFAGPLPGYLYIPNKHSHLYLIAGGAGITPTYQLQGVLNNPVDQTAMTLVFGVNAGDDLVLGEELDAFKARFPERSDVVYTVNSLEEGGDNKLRRGRITEALLRQVMQSDEDQEEDVKVLVRGPPAMEKALLGGNGVLMQLDYSKEQVYKF